MDTDLATPSATDSINVEHASHSKAERDPQPKSAWHRPILSRIDIKRTMSDGGSPIDGFQTGHF